MATILRMKRQDKNAEEKKKPSKKALYPVSSFNDLNELSSKSLLANVLNTNDSFGVLKSNKLNLKRPIEFLPIDCNFWRFLPSRIGSSFSTLIQEKGLLTLNNVLIQYFIIVQDNYLLN